jgi:hypothetical protein
MAGQRKKIKANDSEAYTQYSIDVSFLKQQLFIVNLEVSYGSGKQDRTDQVAEVIGNR